MSSKLCVGTCRVIGSGGADNYCISCVFAPGARFVVVGTKDGFIKVVDSASLEVVCEQSAGGCVWSLAVRPDGQGLMAGCGDKAVKFYDFTVASAGLAVSLARELSVPQEVLCVRYSPTRSADKLLFAAGLLDNTVKVFFHDSMKFFLSLYGHSLPVLCVDFSWDCSLLVSGSADKTIKIWGLDFGDCHRSLQAHTDSVSCIRFQPKTHYFLSAGKDGVLKYWDADRFEQVQQLPGHRGSVWGLDVAPDGGEVVSGGQDRSIRSWSRSEDLVFVEEERERALEAQVDQAAVEGQVGSVAVVGGGGLESVKSVEQLMEGLELVTNELQEMQEGVKNTNVNSNPLLLGLSPLRFMLRLLRTIKAPDLEATLLLLPFTHATLFLRILVLLVRRGNEVELCARCALFLISSHQPRIASSSQLLGEVASLHSLLGRAVDDYRQLTGEGCAGLKYLMKQLQEDRLGYTGLDAVLAEEGLSGNVVKKNKKKKGKRESNEIVEDSHVGSGSNIKSNSGGKKKKRAKQQ